MPFFETSGIRYWAFDSLLAHGVKHGFITRRGGVSRSPWASLNVGGTTGDDENHVRQNHQRIFNAFERPMNSMFDVWQVHGKDVVTTQKARPAGTEHEKADGILTNNHAVTLFMRFADCVPIILYDPVHQAGGIVHAGWMGTVKKISAQAVIAMQKTYQSAPADIVAAIGPSIGPDDYEIGQNVIDAVHQAFDNAAIARLLLKRNGSVFFDLWAANEIALREVGVNQVECAGISTFAHVDDWFSHRKEKGTTGRFGVLFCVPERGNSHG